MVEADEVGKDDIVGGKIRIAEEVVTIVMLKHTSEGCLGKRDRQAEFAERDPVPGRGYSFTLADAPSRHKPSTFSWRVATQADQRLARWIRDDQIDCHERRQSNNVPEGVGVKRVW